MEKELRVRVGGGGGEVRAVRLLLWDTAGQEMFARLTRSYYRGAGAVIFVFSTIDRDSFLELPRWQAKVREEVGEEVVAVLVQNKVDLLDQAVVSAQEAEDMARRLGLRLYRTAVKDNVLVEQVFHDISARYIDGGGGSGGWGEGDSSVAQISDLTARDEALHTQPGRADSSAAAAPTIAHEEGDRRSSSRGLGGEGGEAQVGGSTKEGGGSAEGGIAAEGGASSDSSSAVPALEGFGEATEDGDGGSVGKRRRRPRRGDERVAGAFQLTPLTVRTNGKKSSAIQQLLCTLL